MKLIKIALLALVVTGCGAKKYTATHPTITEIDGYVTSIDKLNTLEQSFEKGTITNETGTKDVGKYEKRAFFDTSKELQKIVYIENFNVRTHENFYYKNNKLVYIDARWKFSKTNTTVSKKVYLINNKVVYETVSEEIPTALLVTKGENFLKEFNKN